VRILITGASGFAASHLLRELEPSRHAIFLTSRRKFKTGFRGGTLSSFPADLSRAKHVRTLIQKTKPEAVVHLSALPHVGHSWKSPKRLVESNIQSTHNLCEALVGRSVQFLFVSSAMVYGASAQSRHLNESSPIGPTSPYGMSKLASELILDSYRTSRFRVTVVRPFNHTGPSQSLDYVCPAFAKRIASANNRQTIPVGSLEARRDFTDVRDIVRAYRLILEKKPSEPLFVLGSGRAVSIRKIFKTLVRISGKNIRTKTDPKLLQKKDVKILLADPALAKRKLGWNPRIPLEKTLRDIYFEQASATKR
jgi:GDP-4-dehydro-6-deoxy-D-mannose reductase